ncbi:MAG: hypothetical protein ACI8PZ_001772 [Myxococcota bacterium]|jgi:hypothetical protein
MDGVDGVVQRVRRLAASLQRASQGVQAVEPERGQPIHIVLLFGEHEGQPSGQLGIVVDQESDAMQQRGLAHPALAEDQAVGRCATGVREQVARDAVEERGAAHEPTDQSFLGQ